MKYLIETAPIESVVIAILKALCLSDIPVNQRMSVVWILIIFALHTVAFVSGNSYILDYRICLSQLAKVLLSWLIL